MSVTLKAPSPRVCPKTKMTLRAMGGQRIMVEGFGRRAPVFVAIARGDEAPRGAWLAPSELRRLVKVVKRILK